VWPGTETYCILERFVDFWEIVEWGLGLSYNSGFSFCNLMQSDAIFIASAAAVSTLQSTVLSYNSSGFSILQFDAIV
jgi:hypothetical protein